MTATHMPAVHAGSLARIAGRPADRSAVSSLTRAALRALVAWRDRRRAVGHLRRLSDAQLRDLGVTRLDIERVVRGDLDPGCHRGRHS